MRFFPSNRIDNDNRNEFPFFYLLYVCNVDTEYSGNNRFVAVASKTYSIRFHSHWSHLPCGWNSMSAAKYFAWSENVFSGREVITTIQINFVMCSLLIKTGRRPSGGMRRRKTEIARERMVLANEKFSQYRRWMIGGGWLPSMHVRSFISIPQSMLHTREKYAKRCISLCGWDAWLRFSWARVSMHELARSDNDRKTLLHSDMQRSV